MKVLFFLLLPAFSFAQIPGNAKIITVKGVSFTEACNQLLDKGYTIESKDERLQTARTTARIYPKHWNASYRISVRIKDSAAIITSTYSSPPESNSTAELWASNVPVYYDVSKKGKPYPKSMPGYAFGLVNEFALSFGKSVEYSK
jgi:hypothetical protein